jgi:hypothetical protein
VLVAQAVGALGRARRSGPAAPLRPEAAAGVAGAARHRALDVAQLGLYVRLERAPESGGKLHVWMPEQQEISAPAYGGAGRYRHC